MSLIDFKLVDTQVTDTTQKTTIDGHEKDLVNGMDNLTLDTDKTTLTDTLAPKLNVTDTVTPQLDMTEKEYEVEGTKDEDLILTYNITEQEHLVEAWCSLEQYIGLKEDKLSSTTVDFIRSEGNLKTKCLYWFRKPKMC